MQAFFKTGPGEYAAGDVFYGIAAPQIKKLVKKYRDITCGEIKLLLRSPMHEERLLALLILVHRFMKGDERVKKRIFDLYLGHTASINNWDLVDLTAYHIVGEFLRDKPKGVLKKLARSDNLWERRIAIVSTFAFIKRGDCGQTLSIARILLKDTHDLIHKAVGWMLREAGKRCCREKEELFLRRYCRAMPRTMLRYAIERFPEDLRKKYLKS